MTDTNDCIICGELLIAIYKKSGRPRLYPHMFLLTSFMINTLIYHSERIQLCIFPVHCYIPRIDIMMEKNEKVMQRKSTYIYYIVKVKSCY